MVVDHLADPSASCFHQCSVRLHFDLFGYLADLQHDIDLRIRPDLQHDSTLKVGFESGEADFQHVWPDGQVRQDVIAGFVGYGSAFGAGCCLRDADFNAG